ncbi:hypothetical protein ACIHDR_46735 [Nocardia sp. NPDC052278]|uniref:hypothetical protein n=1 Tax=unclassified Nocardia TaxID=2637762 RepID=UPI0036B2B454
MLVFDEKTNDYRESITPSRHNSDFPFAAIQTIKDPRCSYSTLLINDDPATAQIPLPAFLTVDDAHHAANVVYLLADEGMADLRAAVAEHLDSESPHASPTERETNRRFAATGASALVAGYAITNGLI